MLFEFAHNLNKLKNKNMYKTVKIINLFYLIIVYQ